MTAAAALLVIPGLIRLPSWLDPLLLRSTGLVLFTLGGWALVVFPEFVTALAFFLIAMVLHIAPAQVVFSGFASVAWWLVFGGLIVGMAIDRTGLGRRLARMLFGRLRGAYIHAVGAVALAAVGLAFLMPSTMGRVVLLSPIVLSLAERLGFAAGSRGRTGLVMTAALATYVPATAILPASVPGTVLLGAVEQSYGIHLTYGPYLMMLFPVLGIGFLALLVPLAAWVFNDQPKPVVSEDVPGHLSREEFKLAWILAIALLMFVFDFLHGISPAWVSLAAGLACLLPGIAIIDTKTFSERVNLAVLVYIAAIIGIGAVVGHSGLGARFSAWLIEAAHLQSGAPVYNFAAVMGLSVLVGVAVTLIPQPAVLAPLAGDIARAADLPLMVVLMIYVLGFATLLFPYQSGPLVVAMQLGGVSARDGTRLTLLTGVATLLILAPLAYAWWWILGWIG
jgi:di/tricarboxylate transporter